MKSYQMKISGNSYRAHVLECSNTHARIEVNGRLYEIEIENDNAYQSPLKPSSPSVPLPLKSPSSPPLTNASSDIKAPLPGIIIKVLPNKGDFVKSGDVLFILEAMKMETEIFSPCDGYVQNIHTAENNSVMEGDLLLTLVNNLETVTTKDTVVAIPLSPSPQKQNKKQESIPVDQPNVKSTPASGKLIKAPLPGIIQGVKTKVGAQIIENESVFILEAMKMETEIFAPFAGKVKAILVNKGDSVQHGQPLLEIE